MIKYPEYDPINFVIVMHPAHARDLFGDAVEDMIKRGVILLSESIEESSAQEKRDTLQGESKKAT